MVVDLARLREQTIGSNVDAEAVTVNTRALIDKVLARYSGDWTTLRELIQNAADASASKVTIRLETLPSRSIPVPQQADQSNLLNHTISNHTVSRLVVSNNGQHFAESDWARLKRIAEGNPDETKIGAFGVGFYSVFADCEEPFVISGRKTMAFLWKGNSLYTKASTIPADQGTQETCFYLNYRNSTSPVPELLSICQFLSTSLTFVGLRNIELWVDQWKIMNLAKVGSPEVDAKIPTTLNTKTREGLMKIVGVTHQSTQISATWMNIIAKPKPAQAQSNKTIEEAPVVALKSFFSRITAHATQNSSVKRAAREAEAAKEREINDNLHLTSQATVFLRVSTVNIQTSVSNTFAAELERATKKPPPRKTKIAILTASRDEASASLTSTSGITEKKAEELFASVLPTKHGRVFIGFPTAQTTGMLCHISAPSVIPTVERENIDLNARYVKTWNTEMLRVAGIACRIAYSEALDDLKRGLNATIKAAGRVSPTPEDIEALVPQASHIFQQYNAQESTPSYLVGQLIDEAFWECSTTIDVLSSKGVLPSSKVRVVLDQMTFLAKIPIIPQSLAKSAEGFVRGLYNRGLLTDMTVADVRKELESQALTEEQLVEFLKWLAKQVSSSSLDITTVQSMLNAAVGAVDGKMVVLSQIKTFLSGNRVSPTLPIPSTTIPFKVTKGISSKDLEQFNWEDLHILPWVRFLVEGPGSSELTAEQDITKSPDFASNVLQSVSKHWDQLDQTSKTTVIGLLSTRTTMPTKMGMKLPSESYFQSVKLFDDLPTITAERGLKEKFLTALGVRKTIELNVVFDRLMTKPKDGTIPQWSFRDLVTYLISVKQDIPAKDIQRLRTADICPIEVAGTKESTAPGRLFPIHGLYEPKTAHRELGLPLLHWPGYFPSSPEGEFLRFLGLKSHPQMATVVDIMLRASKTNNTQMYSKSLSYFLEYYDTNGYAATSKASFESVPYLPVEGKPLTSLYTPKSCFSNEKATVLGYPILLANLRSHAEKFGVKRDPPIKDCMDAIIGNPPSTKKEAEEVFTYFATRLGEIGTLVGEFGKAHIVPVPARNDKNGMRLTTPNMVFLGDSSNYGNILDFVDFGQAANAFLLNVGAKMEPTSLELAAMVKDSPARVMRELREERYLELIRRLAENIKTLKLDKQLWKSLREAPFLVAYRQFVPDAKSRKNVEKEDQDEEERIEQELVLRKASEIVVADAWREYTIFRDYLYIAPFDEPLEQFYLALGVPTLQSILLQDERIGNVRRDQSEGIDLRKLIMERSRLFLHDNNQEILHDAKWLDKNLNVVVTDSLSLSIAIKGYRVPAYRENKTAMLSHDRRSTTLFITHRPDLYEVSRNIARLLLARPKQNDVLALETVLTSDLKRLRYKGYNVDRILRKKEYETRMAEEERKTQQAEQDRMAEQRRKAEAEQAKSLPPPPGIVAPPPYDASGESSPLDPKRPTMPGSFDEDSPPKRGRNMFAQVQEWSKQLTTNLRDRDRTPTGASSSHDLMTGPQGGGKISEPVPPTDAVNSDRNVSNNLANAIKASRAYNSNSLFSPPKSTTVAQAETGSYCDTTTAQNLVSCGVAGGIRVFIAAALETQRESFTSENSASLNLFASLLIDLASIFALPVSNMQIYYDPSSASIAFNTDGALFFNYYYFSSLHLPTYQTSRDKKIDAVAYWFVTMCHELAHNLVQEHSAAHSFYTESFVGQYFSRAMQRALQY